MTLMEEQFIKAYDDFSDAIFRHCYYRVFSRDRAKELTQETFMRVWEYLRDGKTVENIRAFLYRVATNLIIDESRRKKESSLEELGERGFDPPDVKTATRPEKIAEQGMAFTQLQKLESPYREAVLLRFIGDLQPKEIAEVLGESENVVSVRIHRGMKKLREALEV